ncbi:MAG TPA: CoA-binding protein [Miltoncostaeaceae bacterium]|nr:CoA-binding protein [Miltoncostaeaceae bacterium]
MSEDIKDILTTYKRVAVVGASPKPDRPSHEVMEYLIAAGYDVIPVNPRAEEVLGIPCAKNLAEAAARGPLEIVDIFRRSEDIPPVVDEAIAAGAKVVWMQLGIRNAQAAATARAAGLQVVEDHCMKIEHGRRVA